jgi:hypothetical protein
MHTSTSELTRPAIAIVAGSDIELALQPAAGNAMAFETIVRRNNRLLFRTARGVSRLVQMQESANPADQVLPEEAMPIYTPGDEEPMAVAERGELRALLQASIEDLPIIYRSVFMLRAAEELTVEETALCLSVSEDVVKTRFLRARAMLRETLSTRIETSASDTFTFAGARCDAVLSHVMAELLRRHLARLH